MDAEIYERLPLNDCGDGTAHSFGILGSEEIVGRKFFGQLAQELLRQGILFFTSCRESQHDLAERPQIAAAFGGFADLLHAELFVSVNSAEPQGKTKTGIQRADNVIGNSQGDISIGGVGMPRQDRKSTRL